MTSVWSFLWEAPMRRTALAFIVVLAGCSRTGGATDPCVGIAREYQAAMPDAMICDPSQPNPCAAGRPMVVSVQGEDGTITLEGLCLCEGAVNPARTATVDALLARFGAAGCQLQPCWCPPPEWMPATCSETGVCRGVWSLGP
jgi:hypothetical protein